MAAYAALVSLMNTIHQIKHHPFPPISLDKNQVESLTKNLTFLQQFLEHTPLLFGYSNEADPLEMRIADAAYAAEDVIESHIVDRILAAGSTSTVDLYEGVRKVIAEMDGIEREVIEMKIRNSPIPGGSSLSASSISQSNTMVGFDDFLLEIMDKLTGSWPDRLIIPIVGMGGIGKTTLARNLYEKPLIKEHFDVCAWVTISQEYNNEEILKEILYQVEQGRRDSSRKGLGEELRKYLYGRRYLIVLDDMWSVEAWDKIKLFFPDNKNGSRIVVTTRLKNLGFDHLTGSYSLEIKLLDEDKSWDLFLGTVFGEGGCPPQLEEIGKKIVENCEGLPLSIVVIGGLLAKHKHTRVYWEYTAENLSSVVNSEDDDNCLKILHMSYNQLPVHLKPCFLYMGVYSKESMIHVSTLIRLWVAEGFLKPISGKSFEEIAEEYLKELINRNLILIHKLGSTGSIKYCMMHDLVRDLCLREAQKQRFYYVAKHHTTLNLPQSINTLRRLAILDSTSQEKVLNTLKSVSLARSLIWDIKVIKGALPSNKCRLLRILSMFSKYSYGEGYLLENVLQLVNSKQS